MRVGSLFSGIGGLDRGLEMAGMKIVWQVEIDLVCLAVLKKYWLEVPKYGDIRKLDPAELEPVDLICGGFPCQPFSTAGKRRGTADDRYLWPEMFRIIKAFRPAWVLGENVIGITNLALDIVLSDLESEGYETATFIIPACAVGAPHRRDRVWIVAYTAGKRLEGEVNQARQIARCNKGEIESRLGGIANGLAYWVDLYNWPAPFGCEQYEWEPPRIVTGNIPYRRQRLQALGNAVVPLIPYVIGTAILEVEKELNWGEEVL